MDDSWRDGGHYEADFYAWANEQAALLRAGRFVELDIDNVVEELEALARSEKRELVSRLTVLLAHLLKWQFQAGWRGKSWRLTVKEQRRAVARHLQENPSLEGKLAEAIADAYEDAVTAVQKATPLTDADLPPVCPYTQEQLLDADFLPGQPAEPSG